MKPNTQMTSLRQKTEHLLCSYCGLLFPCTPDRPALRHDEYPDGCPVTPPENEDCYTCGSENNCISTSQRNSRGWRARCTTCIDQRKTGRYQPFNAVDKAENEPTRILFTAVSIGDCEKVSECLRNGQDPNAKRQLWRRDAIANQYLPLWMEDGSPYEETDESQPNTPLKSVIFSLSNCLLMHSDYDDLGSVAKVLIKAGADPSEAISYAASRYGMAFQHVEDVITYFTRAAGPFGSARGN